MKDSKEEEFDKYERMKIAKNSQEFTNLCESVVKAVNKQDKDVALRILASNMYPYQLELINSSFGVEAEKRCKKVIEELVGVGGQ